MSWINHLISPALTDALGWAVVHSLWQVLAVSAVLALVFLLKKNWSAQMRYRFACTALFLCLLLFGMTFTYLFFQNQAASAALANASDSSIFSAIVAMDSSTASLGIFESLTERLSENLSLITSFWMFGVFLLVLRFLFGWNFLYELRKNSNTIENEKIEKAMNSIASQLNLKREIQLIESSHLLSPLTFGHFKPFVVLPVGMTAQLSIAEIKAIIAHELSHVYRSDFLVNIIQSISEILFYFHPGIWYINDVIRTEREHCCDDLAIELTGDALGYAKLMMQLKEREMENPTLALAFSGRKTKFFQRISRIINHQNKRSHMFEKMITATLIFIMMLAYGFSSSVEALEDCVDSDLMDFSFFDDATEVVDSTDELSSISEPATEVAAIEEPKAKDEKRTRTLFLNANGREVEVEVTEGEIQSMNVAGEQIAPDKFEEYSAMDFNGRSLKDIVSGKKLSDSSVSQYSPPEPPEPPESLEGLAEPDIPIPFYGNIPVPPPTPAAPDAAAYFHFNRKLNTAERHELIENLRGLDQLSDVSFLERMQDLSDLEDINDILNLEDLNNKLDLNNLDDLMDAREQVTKALERARMQFEILETGGFSFEFDEVKDLEEHFEMIFEENEGGISISIDGDDLLSDLGNELDFLGELGNLQGSWNIDIDDDSGGRISYMSSKDDCKNCKNCQKKREKKCEKKCKEYEKCKEKHNHKAHAHGHTTYDPPLRANLDAPDVIAEKLYEDGLIDDPEDFKFKIKKDKMKVNGETYSGKFFQKYKKLVEKLYGSTLKKGSSIEINVKQ